MKARRVLVTGFGPFGNDHTNPSGLVAETLGGLVLPVAAEPAWQRVRAELAVRRADFVLALGVAGGRRAVCVEKEARNEAAYPIPDDEGAQLTGPLDPQSDSSALRTLADAAAFARAIRNRRLPARVSRDAGRYVCNHFYWLLLRELRGRALFLHLPRLPEIESSNGPTLPLADSLRAVEATLRLLL